MRQAVREDAEADGADDLRSRKRSKGKGNGKKSKTAATPSASELDAEDAEIRNGADDGQDLLPSQPRKGKGRGRGKRTKRIASHDTQHK